MKIKLKEVTLNYQISGEGKPLILLHGNGESHLIFKELIESLSGSYKTYAIDSRGHGESDGEVNIAYDDMAKDIIEFIETLKIKKPNILGFSDGGIVALKIALLKPDLIEKMILCGVNFHFKGLDKKIRKEIEREYYKTKSLLLKLMLKSPVIRKKELKAIENETLIIAGENDVIKKTHTKKLSQLLKNSQLIILDDHNHYSYIVNQDDLKKIIIDFI